MLLFISYFLFTLASYRVSGCRKPSTSVRNSVLSRRANRLMNSSVRGNGTVGIERRKFAGTASRA